MKKRFITLQFEILFALALLIGVSCSKKDITSVETKGSILSEKAAKVSSTSEKQKASSTSGQQPNKTFKHRKHPKERSIPIPKRDQSSTTMSTYSATYGCGGLMTGEYTEINYYNYPAYYMNFDNELGSTVTLDVTAFEIPDNFTVLDPNGQIIAQSGWLGTAQYSGPWGSELYANDNSQLTFQASISGNYTLQVETQTYHTSDYWEAQISCVAPTVSTVGNHIKFETIAVYEQYADNLADRNALNDLSYGSSVTTLAELDPNDENDLYPEFLEQILNQDHIVEIGSFLVKVDLENQRVLAIKSADTNAYQILVTDQLSASGLMIFNDDVSNGIDILIGVENGSLTTSNYQSAIETSDTYTGTGFIRNNISQDIDGIDPLYGFVVSRGGPSPFNSADMYTETSAPLGCRHARRKIDEDGPEGIVWDTKTGQEIQCPDGILAYKLVNKVVYQKFVIYFSLQAKMKSWYAGTCEKEPNANYDAHLRLDATVKFKKRCGIEQVLSKPLTVDDDRLNWRPFESCRSLSQYDYTVYFRIKHFASTGDYVTPREYRISDGY